MLEGTTLDYVLHVATALLAAILFIIASLTYAKQKKTSLLFVAAGFFLSLLREAIIVLDVLYYDSQALVGISHALTFLVLLSFFGGLVR